MPVTLTGSQLDRVTELSDALDRSRSVLYIDAPGRGKTYVCIQTALNLSDTGPHLIVTISNMTEPMTKSCEDFWEGSTTGPDPIFTVVSYNSFSNAENIAQLGHRAYHTVVFDEGHMLRDFDSNRIRRLMSLACVNMIVATGTPFQVEASQLRTVLAYMFGPMFVSVDFFAGRSSDHAPLEHLLAKLHGAYLINGNPCPIAVERYMVAYRTYLCRPGNLQLDKLQAGTNANDKFDAAQYVKEEQEAEKAVRSVATMAARGGKLVALLQLVNEFIGRNEKVVVFADAHAGFEPVCAWLELNGYRDRMLQYDRSLDFAKRAEIVSVFNDPDSPIKIIVGTWKVMSTGINLAGARNTIFYSPTGNAAEMAQAVARTTRPPQSENNVLTITSLLLADSRDIDRYNTLRTRLRGFWRVLYGSIYDNTVPDPVSLPEKPQDDSDLVFRAFADELATITIPHDVYA